MNRSAAQRLMQAEGLDALVLFSAEGFAHATGAAPGVATMWRREGAVAVLVIEGGRRGAVRGDW